MTAYTDWATCASQTTSASNPCPSATTTSLTEALRDLSQEALGQIGKRRYDAEAPENMPRVRYGIAFAGKRVAVEGARA